MLKYTELDRVDTNFEQYQKLMETNKIYARVFSASSEVKQERSILFEQSEHKFQLVREVTKYGVSTNLRRYCRKKRTRVVTVNNGKFYLHIKEESPRSTQIIKPLAAYHLTSCGGVNDDKWSEILVNKYSWIRFLKENNIQTSFNNVVANKLYDLKKALTYEWKVPYPIAKKLHEKAHYNSSYEYQTGISLKSWKQMCKSLINIENFNFELLENYRTLVDATKMALKLNRKLNAKWSMQRMVNEHNEMSRIIGNILIAANDRPLKIQHERYESAIACLKSIGAELIETTSRLTQEGMFQSHCVGGYASDVDWGKCLIFHHKGYTLELKRDSTLIDPFYIGQFRGLRNCSAPEELRREVQCAIDAAHSIDRQKRGEPAIQDNGFIKAQMAGRFLREPCPDGLEILPINACQQALLNGNWDDPVIPIRGVNIHPPEEIRNGNGEVVALREPQCTYDPIPF